MQNINKTWEQPFQKSFQSEKLFLNNNFSFLNIFI